MIFREKALFFFAVYVVFPNFVKLHIKITLFTVFYYGQQTLCDWP